MENKQAEVSRALKKRKYVRTEASKECSESQGENNEKKCDCGILCPFCRLQAIVKREPPVSGDSREIN
jgi:hypothetical protein